MLPFQPRMDLGVTAMKRYSSFPKSITGTSSSDCLVSYIRTLIGGSYPDAEVQSVYSKAPDDWARKCTGRFDEYCSKTVIKRSIVSDLKFPFSVDTTARFTVGALLLSPDCFNWSRLSVKQGGINYHFLIFGITRPGIEAWSYETKLSQLGKWTDKE